ncbi:helix-turn-helix transcriptional regulator [Herbiconiux sp. CPCC 205763]|uniref:Helix-turn-helix transcriptional regulator n=1 Tax=Herbiconiux aconitum TaxID=2970913 RepID=A0ABT2GQR2_9MICO|nr:helix-turn-helix domain-containing protein [Herbiconiux aconitum]MCS5718565.1 helix-turn-helix transcriptional regulator [Herbiconiux aconitum]
MTSSTPPPVWHHIDDAECRRFTSSVELVGKRWSSGILLAIAQGATRFSDIVASVSGLSDRLLAQRLKELERVGLVTRSVIATTPVQVRYALTPRGADLLQSLQPLVAWGQRWEGESAAADAPVKAAAPSAAPPAAAPAPSAPTPALG